MSQDRPDLPDLIRTVREFLDGLRPTLEGVLQYHAVVASYLLGIVEREVAMSAAFERREREQLAGLLGDSAPLPELERALCEAIRAGRYDDKWEELFDIVMEQVVNKVRIVRPEHLDAVHAPPPVESRCK